MSWSIPQPLSAFYSETGHFWGWRVHQKGLLTWENAVNDNGRSGHERRHFL